MSAVSAARLGLFVSSVQEELADERRAIKSLVEGDALLRSFFTAFLFEDLPPTDRRPDAVYLAEVDRCAIYVGLFGLDYARPGVGVSPTEREFDRATEQGKHRLVFVKGRDDDGRDPRMRALVQKAGAQVVWKRFESTADLTRALQDSLVEHLKASGAVQTRAFDDRPAVSATIEDVEARAVADFVTRARRERQFPLPAATPAAEVLAHLHLLLDGRPTNAAVLLFGSDPQRFLPAAEVRCMHFHGTDVRRPAPFYRIFKGSVFEQIDLAVDLALSKLNRSVGTRDRSSRAPARDEVPPDVVREAIVNAVAHRDYTAAGAVQVSVFADRVEIRNPGTLLAPLTPAALRHAHGSVTRNPRLCEALFLNRYIEKFGTGTLMMIRESLAHGLPEPDFAQEGGEFTTTIWRDWLTADVLAGLHLNDRQLKALPLIRRERRIVNSKYQTIAGTTRATAKRDLDDLVKKGLIESRGSGRGAHYQLSKKRPTNGANGSPDAGGA